MERTQLMTTEMRQRASAIVMDGGDRVKLWATREIFLDSDALPSRNCAGKMVKSAIVDLNCHLCEKSVADPSGDVKVFIASFPQCPTLVSSIQHP